MNPKSPRHWLLSRHASANSQLDQLRRQTLAAADAAPRFSPSEMRQPTSWTLRTYLLGAGVIAALVVVARVMVSNRPMVPPGQPVQAPVPTKAVAAQPAIPVIPRENQTMAPLPLVPSEPVAVATGSSAGNTSNTPVAGPTVPVISSFGAQQVGGRGGPSGGGRVGPAPMPSPADSRQASAIEASRIYTVRELDASPSPTLKILPTYPPALKRSGIEGSVKVSAVVSESGSVQSARVVESSDRGFELPALDAVRKWKFRPGQKAGKSVPTEMEFPIDFRLDGKK